MLSRFLALPRLLARWDERWLPSFLLRALVVLTACKPWEFRFVPSPVPMTDIDPAVLAFGRSQGIDLLDRAVWPTAAGVFARVALMVLLLTAGWWVVSRLRRWLTERFGTGVGSTLALSIVFLLAVLPAAYSLGRTGPMGLFSTGNDGLSVWGGWLKGSLFEWYGMDRMMPWLLGVAYAMEIGHLLIHGRLALLEARDGALRARLAPHFLFNALNTLHAQIETEPAEAQETTERLAGLFRQVLEVTERPTVPLSRELAFVEDYLGIERARLGARLVVEVEVPEAAASAQVPVLALQVLVENAIKHGVEPRVQGGTVRIAARLEGRRLVVAVTDPGDGTARAGNGAGRALVNLRARLARPRDLVMEPAPEGFRVAFSFPQSA